MARLLAVAATIGVLVLAPSAHADRPEACLAINPAVPYVTEDSCGYGPATVEGGIDAVGDWIVTIDRPVEGTITVDSASLPPEPTCYRQGPRSLCPIGIVQPGDTVLARATTSGSVVGVGNPCPVANPGVPPPVLGGEC